MLSQRLNTILIENNPYDRAVIDAAVQHDPNILLRYTDPKKVTALDLVPNNWRTCFGGNKPHIVLLDLALSAECEEQIPSADFQIAIREARGVLPALTLHLEQSQRDMEPLVQATYLICRARAAEGDARLMALQSLSQLQASKRLKLSIEPIVSAVEKRGLVSQAILDASLKSLWGGEAKARLAKTITQAPSLWRILIAIAQNPDVCFFVVSHFINDTFGEPLQDLLGARHVTPVSQPDFYRAFLISKSDLSNLSDRIRCAYEKWQNLSLSSVMEPFSCVPVMNVLNGEACTLRELISLWEYDHLAQAGVPPQILLWDDTATLNRGKVRWELILRPWANSLLVVEDDSPKGVQGEEKDILLVNTAVISNAIEANRWAVNLRDIFAQRQKDGWETIVIAGGTDTSRVAVSNVLGQTRQYKIPPLHFWDKATIKTLLERLSVFPDDGRVRIPLWCDPPPQEASSLDCFLIANTRAPKEVMNRVVARLKRHSVSTTLPPFDEVMQSLEILLMALKVTAGTDQDWQALCQQYEFQADSFWR